MAGYDSYVKALLHLNVDLTDLSGKIWTANGGAAVSATDPKFGAKCLYLDGTQYIDTPDHANWTMGSDPFTVDFWMKRSRILTAEQVIGVSDATGDNTACSFTFYLVSADVYAMSLLHLNGANLSTTITDIAPNFGELIWTARNHAKLSTTSPKFGSAALLLDGTDDYVDTPDSGYLTMGSGDFTIDFWMKRGATGAQYVMGQMNNLGQSVSISFLVYITASNTISFYVGNGAATVNATSTGTITDTTTWHHIACVRDGNTLRLFIDGVPDGTGNVTGVTINNSGSNLSWGRGGEYASGYFNGRFDEPRISKGIARWTSDFSSALPTEYVYDRMVFGICSGATGYGGYSSVDISDITTWHHIAGVRNGNNLLLFIDGVLVGTFDVTGVSANDSSNKLAIGRKGECTTGRYFKGYVDEPRISKGIARWTSDFTPPTEEYDGNETINAGLLTGSKSIYAVSENTDQILSQNLISKAGSLLSSSFILDQILAQNLQSGNKTIFQASNVTDQILSQNLLTSITSVLSVLVSIDQSVSVNVIPVAGSLYEVTVDTGAVGIIVNVGLLLAIGSALESSLQTDQILSQGIIEKLGSVFASSQNTDQILQQNMIAALGAILSSSQSVDQTVQLNALSALASIYQILVQILAAPEKFGYLNLKLEAPPALPEGDFTYEQSSLKMPDMGPEGDFHYKKVS